MLASIFSISAGASLGALLRWLLAGRLNPLFPALPLGTLAANLIGGYLIGVAVAVFPDWPEVSPPARLVIVTGFLGGAHPLFPLSRPGRPGIARGAVGLGLSPALPP